ncbi:amino acid adenylation domain-containing protein [Nonomuraea sp. NPDC049269]|uniref:amino acid adenylation domain-containing protein n=1 Tax=Nonomuraea sp. NPDC049269 TaxID=3364349 RepID=UPI003722BC71
MTTTMPPDAGLLVRRYLDRSRRSRPAPIVARTDRDSPPPLSAGQRRLWLLDRIRPGGTEYLVPVALRLRGPLDAARLRAALDGLAGRHEILRTRYAESGGEPYQLVDPPGPVPLTSVNLSAERELRVRGILAAGTRRPRPALDALLAQEGERPFDLAAEWPLRAALFALPGGEHVLLLTGHHIAVDGVTMDVLVDELCAEYAGGVPAAPALQYADYTDWQRAFLAGPAAARQLGYWTRRLAGVAPLELPADRTRPAEWDAAGDVVTFDVPAAEAAAALAEGARRSATPFMTLLAAFWAVLGRYAGTDDVAVGTPVAGRSRMEFERLPGYFANTLVLRGDLSGEPSFGDLVGQALTAVTEAYDHQDVPFERIVEELRPGRDLAVNPLFQALLTYREDTAAARAAGSLAVVEEPVGWSPARVDIALDITLRPDGSLRGALVYPTALFTRATAEGMAGHLVTFLRRAGRAPGVPVREIALTSTAERERLLTGWNATTVNRPAHCLPDRFAARAARDPGAVALVTPAGTMTYGELDAAAGTMTYGELDAAANRLAQLLRSRGAGPESRVAVCLDRSADLVIALLATVKAGAAYVPIDPEYPRDRIAYLVTDSAAHVVLTSAAHAHLCPPDAVVLDGLDLAAFPATPPPVPRDPDGAAYVIYTSGSTGRPKGVVVSHRAIANRLDWMQDAYRLTPADAVLQKTPFGFDVSVWEFFWPLAEGARLVVAAPGGHRDGAYLRDLIVGEQVTVCHFVPSMLRSFLDVPGVGACTSLRDVMCSGEALPADLAGRFHDLLGARLHNLYGPTEAAVDVTAWACRPGWAEARVPIGGPIDNIAVHVLDEAMRPAPVGVPGELHIGGVGLARGYLGRPGLTAERFVPNPYGAGRLYRTGDVVRRRADGTLDYLGRRDHQVKIRGHRIEPGEVESVLLEHPGVGAAAVIVRDDRLLAYVVGTACADGSRTDGSRAAGAGGGGLDGREVRGWLAGRLPAYLVPAFVVTLDALPVSAHGKLDRDALPAPRAAEAEDAFVAPRDPAERAAAGAWAAALDLPVVGVHGNFFELGGDSIRALRAIALLREAGWEAGVQDMFRHQTPAALATVMTPGTSAGHVPSAPFAHVRPADRALLPSSAADAYPLTQVQAGMLVELAADGELSPYHNVTSYLVRDDGPFSLGALSTAAETLAARHDVLRTSFDLVAYSEPMQLVHPAARAHITVEDLTALPPAEQRAAADAALDRERRQPFDLGRAPLWRLYAQRLDERRWRLGWVECHPILDGWSHNSLLTELLEVYRAVRDGRPVPEPASCAVRFADAVGLERAALASAEQRDFWESRVRGFERLRLPEAWTAASADDPFPYDLRVPVGELMLGLRALAKAAGAPLKSVFLAAHVRVMSMVTTQRAFRTGLGVNGRPEVAGGDRARGMFLNVVPFATGIGPATWRGLVRDVFAEETALWPHRRFPAPEMQRRWSPDEPLIDVLFNYLDFHVLDREALDLAETDDRSATDFALVVSTEPGAVVLSASPRAVRPAWGERLAALYASVLAAMAADPDGDVQADLLPPAEHRLALAGGNARAGLLPLAEQRLALAGGDAAPFLPGLSIHELFAAQAARTPDAIAVEFAPVSCGGGLERLTYAELDCGDGPERLTYTELDAAANRLAHRLAGRGVQPGDVVGICLDRSPRLIVAVLATLKAGGAYLALDATDPPARLAELLADAAPRLVITSAGLASAIGHPDTILLGEAIGGSDPAGPPHAPVTPDDLAYLIYTSGSTGRPKAVAVPHRGVIRLVTGQTYAEFGPGETQLLHSPITFDAATYEIWGALLHGGRLVVAPPGLLDARELREVISRHGVTCTFVTHGLFKLMVDGDLTGLRGLRTLITGGEAVSAEHLERARRALPTTRLVNAYGPTETTTFATCRPLDPGRPVTGPVPIGSAIAHTTAYVLDHLSRPVPLGVPGELHIGGPGVAHGYLGRPALTADRFVPDPYGPEPGARLYRTGDLARLRPDGGFDFLGRMDDQLKIRGHRIEPGEVEAALNRYPGVRMAAVAAREITPGDRRLVGYVMPGTIDVSQLRAHLGGLLPAHLVPDHLVALDAFPMTASGKVDRAALPAPGGSRPDPRTASAPPRDGLERAVAEAFAAVLGVVATDDGGHLFGGQRGGVDAIGREDDFLQLGGHSLAAMRAAARLEAGAGVRVTARDIMLHRTVAALATALASLPRTTAASPGTDTIPQDLAGATAGADAAPSTDGAGVMPSVGGVGAVPLTGGMDVALLTGGADAAPSTGGAGAVLSTGGMDVALSVGGAGVVREAPGRAAVWFRASGERAPLFAVHPGGGSVHWYRELSRRLPGDRPFVALQHPALVNEDAAATPVRRLAEAYLTEVRAAQPAGPYRLFGWCGGTGAVWEMAARLRDLGEEVELLLLDPCLPAVDEPLHLRLLRRGEALLAALADGSDGGADSDGSAVGGDGAGGDGKMRAELAEVLTAVVDDNDGRPITEKDLHEDWAPRLRLWRGMAEAAQLDRPRPAAVPVEIMLTDDLMGDGHDAKGGLTHEAYLREWRRLRGGDVPVGRFRHGHLDVMAPPHVDELAAHIARWLDRADQTEQAHRADQTRQARLADQTEQAQRADQTRQARLADQTEQAHWAGRAGQTEQAHRADRAGEAR